MLFCADCQSTSDAIALEALDDDAFHKIKAELSGAIWEDIGCGLDRMAEALSANGVACCGSLEQTRCLDGEWRQLGCCHMVAKDFVTGDTLRYCTNETRAHTSESACLLYAASKGRMDCSTGRKKRDGSPQDPACRDLGCVNRRGIQLQCTPHVDTRAGCRQVCRDEQMTLLDRRQHWVEWANDCPVQGCLPSPGSAPADHNHCASCPEGTFSEPGATSCGNCVAPPGRLCTERTGTASGTVCPAGKACAGGLDVRECSGADSEGTSECAAGGQPAATAIRRLHHSGTEASSIQISDPKLVSFVVSAMDSADEDDDD